MRTHLFKANPQLVFVYLSLISIIFNLAIIIICCIFKYRMVYKARNVICRNYAFVLFSQLFFRYRK